MQSPDAVRARRRVAQFDSRATESGRHRAFAGAWAGYRFHKHSFTLAADLCAAAALPGVRAPFLVSQRRRGVGCTQAGVVAYVFDVLNVLRSYVVLIIGKVLFFVA